MVRSLLRSFILISILSSFAHMSYGQEKNLLQRYFYEKTPGGWILKTKEDYLYNARHQLIKMISLDSTESGWANHMLKEVIYSPVAVSHQRIEIVREGEGNEWSDPIHTFFLQDKNFHDVMAISMNYDSTNTIGFLFNAGFFTLDELGRPVKKLYVKPQDQKWINEDLTLFTYKDSLPDTEEYSVWENDSWKPQSKTKYYYLPDQRLDHTEIYSVDKVTGTLALEPSTLACYTYDTEKNVIEYRLQKKRSGVWTDVFKRVSVWGNPITGN